MVSNELISRAVTRTCVLLASIVMLTACGGEPERRVERTRVSGNISMPGADADATVYVNLYHAWALQGDLRHPVEFIESFETNVGSYAHEFDYPIDDGEGLLVYAWIDTDGDEILCTPTVRTDRAGLTAVEDFTPPGDVTVDVELTAPCAGPDWFYPPPD